MRQLIMCPECKRHIARREAQCPFCDTAIAQQLRDAPALPLPPSGMSRAKQYAFRAALLASGTAAMGCAEAKPTVEHEPTATAAVPYHSAAAPTDSTVTDTQTAPQPVKTAVIATSPTPSSSASSAAVVVAPNPVPTTTTTPPPKPAPTPLVTAKPPPRDPAWYTKPYGCVWAEEDEEPLV